MGDRSTTGQGFVAAYAGRDGAAIVSTGEELVVDTRGQLRPAEMVERKLVSLLRGVPIPVSHVSASQRKR